MVEARASIGEFLEKVYNQKRLHSRSATCRRRSSKLSSPRAMTTRRPHRGIFLDEFSQACAIYRPMGSGAPSNWSWPTAPFGRPHHLRQRGATGIAPRSSSAMSRTGILGGWSPPEPLRFTGCVIVLEGYGPSRIISERRTVS